MDKEAIDIIQNPCYLGITPRSAKYSERTTQWKVAMHTSQHYWFHRHPTVNTYVWRQVNSTVQIYYTLDRDQREGWTAVAATPKQMTNEFMYPRCSALWVRLQGVPL